MGSLESSGDVYLEGYIGVSRDSWKTDGSWVGSGRVRDGKNKVVHPEICSVLPQRGDAEDS